MNQSTIRIVFIMLGLALTACAEGQWVHPTRTSMETQEDWDTCKAEVLSGKEHGKSTLAGGINLSGCMQSKGYRYLEAPPPPEPSMDTKTNH